MFLGFLSVSLMYVPLCLCQCDTVLMTIALQYSLKSEKMIPPASSFSLRIILSIQGLLCFHTSFKKFCSSSVKNTIDILIGIAPNLQIACIMWSFSQYSSIPRIWYIFASVCVIFNFFHQCFIVFRVQVFCLLRLVYSWHFILFDEMINGTISLISVFDILLCVEMQQISVY